MTLDLTEHLPGTSRRDLNADEFWKELMASIPGFTATHHQLGPLQFDFHDDGFTKATASATVTATYALEEEEGKSSSIVVKGLQSADVEKVEGRWGIRRFKIVRHVPMANLHLFGLAGERVAKELGRAVKK